MSKEASRFPEICQFCGQRHVPGYCDERDKVQAQPYPEDGESGATFDMEQAAEEHVRFAPDPFTPPFDSGETILQWYKRNHPKKR